MNLKFCCLTKQEVILCVVCFKDLVKSSIYFIVRG